MHYTINLSRINFISSIPALLLRTIRVRRRQGLHLRRRNKEYLHYYYTQVISLNKLISLKTISKLIPSSFYFQFKFDQSQRYSGLLLFIEFVRFLFVEVINSIYSSWLTRQNIETSWQHFADWYLVQLFHCCRDIRYPIKPMKRSSVALEVLGSWRFKMKKLKTLSRLWKTTFINLSIDMQFGMVFWKRARVRCEGQP